jgi:hypothetical protein
MKRILIVPFTALALAACVTVTPGPGPVVPGPAPAPAAVVQSIINGAIAACKFEPYAGFVGSLVGMGMGVQEAVTAICVAVNSMASPLALTLSSGRRPTVRGIALQGRRV